MCIHVPLRKMTTPYLHLSCIFNSYSLCLIVTKIKKNIIIFFETLYTLVTNLFYLVQSFGAQRNETRKKEGDLER